MSARIEARLRRSHTKLVAASRERDTLIREARAAGLPLRAIAAAASMSHESVRRIAGDA